ncbi:MAG TPA: FAD-binding oxidoreductase [Blastocatellia bacterium]|nr:FAD-binding oxidoreductase [Blastocatellia bacterium]
MVENLRAEVLSKEKNPEVIHRRLVEEFGQDRALLAIGEHYRLAGEPSRAIALPHTVEELSEMLSFAMSEGLTVIPAGAGTWLNMGNPPVRAHLIISTTHMSRVLEYEPADLTVTVEAGCPLYTFNQLALQHRQWIPLDPFGDEGATLGAIVATASSGPMRCGFGTPRDWVIGMQVVHAYGLTTRAGGKVVKNVAGYDLCKLYTGSYGTLGVITEISFKLRALPPAERTLVFAANDVNKLCALAARITASDVQPAAMELLSATLHDDRVELATTGDGNYVLAVQFFDEDEAIRWQMAEAARLGNEFKHCPLSIEAAVQFWEAFRATEISQEWDLIFKLSVKPSDLPAMIAEAQKYLPESPLSMLRAHAASGVLRLHATSDALNWFRSKERPKRVAELRRRTQEHGGNMVILRAPLELKSQVDVWGEIGPAAVLMHALKEKFDPQNLLNPGRFVSGI